MEEMNTVTSPPEAGEVKQTAPPAEVGTAESAAPGENSTASTGMDTQGNIQQAAVMHDSPQQADPAPANSRQDNISDKTPPTQETAQPVQQVAASENSTGQNREDYGQQDIPSGAQQPQYQQQPGQVPPGYAMDPATGQAVFVGYPGYVQQPVYYAPPQPTPEQIAAQQAAAQQRYGQIVQSVENFLSGETTVSDMVKSLYATTAQEDQLWKGILVGAAAAVVLTNGPVREAMGKTFGGIFNGAKGTKAGTGAGEQAESGKIKPEQSASGGATSTEKE
ncbi:MAG: hypothetical protein CSA20_02140 [Deltaproteobacteria bacterium]|nr:MAG: hypothetical protein CSA20_02140 [Deltaproteobacteria bacterium]